MTMSKRYSIGELADLAGISRRSVRFYVQRGLLPPPLGAGRGHYYTHEHLESLHRIKMLQDAGLSLDEIDQRLGAQKSVPHEGALSEPMKTMALEEDFAPPLETPLTTELWLRLMITPGCELHLDRAQFRATQAQLRRLKQCVSDILDTVRPSAPKTTHEEDPHE